MLYFDNAATTMIKPPEVAAAVAEAMGHFGGVNRGAHDAALSADKAVFRARIRVAELFNAPGPKRVAFCQNATMALNTVIRGLLQPGDHAVTTAASHNSVLRPLYRAHDEQGVELSILPIAPDGSMDYERFDALFQTNTKLAIITHASNLTGDVYDIEKMADIAHAHGALFAIDAAQTAGAIPIDMAAQDIDIVCFTGHKSLYGPQGTGGLVLADGIEVAPLAVGGSGTRSFDREPPEFMPEHLEAGTLNAHGIAGLSAGLAYVQQVGTAEIGRQMQVLVDRFETGVSVIPQVKIYGGHAGTARCGIVALNIGDVDSAIVSDMLNTGFGICTRAGAHCAPLMHKAMGTERQGVVRFSFSHFNTVDEIDQGIEAVAQVAREF